MIKILSNALYKLFCNKEFYIILFIFPLITIFNLIYNHFFKIDDIDFIYYYVKNINSWFLILLSSIIITNMVRNELLHTISSYLNYSKVKKSTVYFSFFLVSCIIIFSFILVETLVLIICGLFKYGNIPDIPYVFFYLMLALAFSLSYSALFLIVPLFINKTIQAISINIIIASILCSILPVIFDLLGLAGMNFMFVPGYIFEMLKNGLTMETLLLSLCTSIIYTSIFYLIGYMLFRHKYTNAQIGQTHK